ncbi:MAG: protein nirF [Candidatus Thiodiazotropha lotti]|uniref:Protein nirF n=1 Tax=Candidatus Thiodiazotropha lotti TaxID=2792787 RepID=A0A9E4K7P7_9GAMM|nr:protein nirF [Candidatus Thiodiazotropha lotti]MCG7940747.1 protein nirF [Candidatus Thiodiazotropha lotti]MCG7982749.1 protein nirF [Candidatus Thiodiazotropha lotti]MCG8002935.1 protein nirF [Candidatus Thiodiazotropha lotti]MCW4186556.1 protein nirF [Candidatus Thiodiazotropha lotti]
MSRWLIFPLLMLFSAVPIEAGELRGTGDLGVVVERAKGSLQVIETSGNSVLGRIDGLGDLSHASVVFSRDERYAYVFGRDGGLTKVDVLERRVVARVIQSGNSIGGAISQDGRLIAVSNYEPGGVRIFDAETLDPVADIPADYAEGQRSKVVGLVDAPGNRFIFSLWDAGEIWSVGMSDPENPAITKYPNVGKNPYDALITPDGRYYIAGLYGEDGLALLDLWYPERGVKRILNDYGKGEQKLPVYKMPHLEGWAKAGRHLFIPAVGQHQVLVVDTDNWQEIGRLDVHGQPVFVIARPDGRQVWVNFAFPNNDTIQVIDTRDLKLVETLKPGKGVLHMEFEPRGGEVWVSVRDIDRLQVYDTSDFNMLADRPAEKPSGIFLSARAHRTGL